MTDLKAANEQLAHALKALESPEHDADVREAEACRNRLMELDERIGARIKAKLEAHKLIAQAWSPEVRADLTQEAIEQRRDAAYWGGTQWTTTTMEEMLNRTGGGTSTIADGLTAEAWTAHHEEHTGKYALAGEQVPDRVMVNGVAEMQQAVQTDEH